MYSIGKVSEMFGLPVSTLRYYDKEGLFPDMMRVSGVRKFSDRELETLRVIECLKKSGMEIKDIRQFIDGAPWERKPIRSAVPCSSVSAKISKLRLNE